jgi:hypothetical protein
MRVIQPGHDNRNGVDALDPNLYLLLAVQIFICWSSLLDTLSVAAAFTIWDCFKGTRAHHSSRHHNCFMMTAQWQALNSVILLSRCKPSSDHILPDGRSIGTTCTHKKVVPCWRLFECSAPRRVCSGVAVVRHAQRCDCELKHNWCSATGPILPRHILCGDANALVHEEM